MNLERAILLALCAAHRALPAVAIAGGLGAFIGGKHTIADVAASLETLKLKGQVIGTPNEDYGMMWTPTPEGRLRIL